VEVVLSPKFHVQDFDDLVETVVNCTTSGAVPEVGEASNPAAGARVGGFEEPLAATTHATLAATSAIQTAQETINNLLRLTMHLLNFHAAPATPTSSSGPHHRFYVKISFQEIVSRNQSE
jgi:hypothetical protein